MDLQGRRLIPAPPAAVWAALNDAAVLQRCIPGCEEVLQISDTERSARVAVKLGPVRARFSGKVSLRDVLPAERCTMVFEGSGGAAGFARGESLVTLLAIGQDTQVDYTVKASIGGKLGQVGGRMIDGAAQGMADEFFNALEREWRPAAPPEVAAADAAPQPIGQLPSARAAAAPSAADHPSLERLRITWFVLGAAATGFGVALARWLG